MAIALTYSSETKNRWRVARRVGYFAIAAVALTLAMLCAIQLPARFRLMRLQKPLLNYQAPGNEVVYADVRQNRPTFLSSQTVQVTTPEWVAFDSAWINFTPNEPTLFIHGLNSPAGSQRIVRVGMTYPHIGSTLACSVEVIKPGSVFSLPVLLTVQGYGIHLYGDALGHALTIFAGQPDPADPRHFLINYQCGGKSSIIDGWLEADDSVKLEPRQQ